MIKTLSSFLLPAFRYIAKNRAFVVLNLLGLTIGLSASLLLIQYAVYEFSYDEFHENSDRIFRVRYDNYSNGGVDFSSAAAVPAVGTAMKDNFPEVIDCAWAFPVHNGFFNVGDQCFHEQKFQIVTPGFLRMFSWGIIHGDTSALSSPKSLVITESCALEYFGKKNSLGRKVVYEDGTEYTVRGIIKDVPGNSHIKFSILASPDILYQRFDSTSKEMWTWYDFNTYILLDEGVDPWEFEDRFDNWLSEHLSEFWEKNNRRQFFSLKPIEDIHLKSNLAQESEPYDSGNANLVIILCIIALSILLTAWFNYINLSSSMAWARSREIGMRKVVGAGKKNIVVLFVSEALIMNILAAILSLGLIELILPFYNRLIDTELTMFIMRDPGFWIALGVLLFSGAFISGIYPAPRFSIHRPIDIINGIKVGFRSALLLRRILVVVQFIVSMGFISGAFFTYSQLLFMKNKSLGIDIDQTVVVWGPGIENDSTYSMNYPGFKNKTTRLEGVSYLTASNSIPGREIYLADRMRRPDQETGSIFYEVGMDEDFIPSFKLELLAGRNFNPSTDLYGSSIIVNVSAMEQFGFLSPEDAIGKIVLYNDDELNIVGVIQDYYQMSIKQAPGPLIYRYPPSSNTNLSVRLNTTLLDSTIAGIETSWEEYFPGVPFEYFFLDQFFDRQYRMERQTYRVLGVFALMAIFIAVLGLIGLSTYGTVQRTKEIGIRKVNGAGVGSIIFMIFREFLELICFAFLISTPLTWLVMRKWLDVYPQHIKIDWYIFLYTGIIVVLIALLSVAVQTIRIAGMNPTDSLKSE